MKFRVFYGVLGNLEKYHKSKELPRVNFSQETNFSGKNVRGWENEFCISKFYIAKNQQKICNNQFCFKKAITLVNSPLL